MENASDAGRALVGLRWKKAGKKEREEVGKMLLDSRRKAKAARDSRKGPAENDADGKKE